MSNKEVEVVYTDINIKDIENRLRKIGENRSLGAVPKKHASRFLNVNYLS